jgi:hypothetical protein
MHATGCDQASDVVVAPTSYGFVVLDTMACPEEA